MSERSPLKRVCRIALAVILGVGFFAVVMGGAIAAIRLNVSSQPELAWFPLPVTLLLVASAYLAERYGQIGFAPLSRASLSNTRLWLIAALITNAGVMACAFQGYFTGYVRDAELLSGVDLTFQRTYAIYMSVFAAALAEISFRGILQTRLQTILSPWTVIVLIGLLNVFSHRWDTDILQNGIGWFVVLAGWTWLRWLSQSLWPPLVMHVVINCIVALWIWYVGPIVHASMPGYMVAVVGIVGLVSLGLSAWLSRGKTVPVVTK